MGITIVIIIIIIIIIPDGATACQLLVGQGLLIIEASRSHTPHSVGPLWTSDQPDAETST